jgi:hypothetical protein
MLLDKVGIRELKFGLVGVAMSSPDFKIDSI